MMQQNGLRCNMAKSIKVIIGILFGVAVFVPGVMRARYGTYQPIDPTTPIRVTYLRATPLPRKARSTATMQATTPSGVVQESEAPYPIQAAA